MLQAHATIKIGNSKLPGGQSWVINVHQNKLSDKKNKINSVLVGVKHNYSFSAHENSIEK